MKSYEEMTACVLAARDAILRKRQRQRTVLLCCLPVVFCAAAAAGFRAYLQRKPLTVQQSDPPAVSIHAETAHPADKEEQSAAGAQASAEPSQSEAEAADPEISAQPQVTENTEPETPAPPEIDLPHLVPTTEPYTEPDVPQTQTDSAGRQLTEADGCPDTHAYRPWDELPVNQQYFGADIGKIPAEKPSDTVFYRSAEQEVPAESVGAYLDEAFMSGFDFSDYAANRYYHCYAKAYRIKGYEPDEAVAIQFEDGGAYYLYVIDLYGSADPAEPDGLTGGPGARAGNS